jgi:hypothetical protein
VTWVFNQITVGLAVAQPPASLPTELVWHAPGTYKQFNQFENNKIYSSHLIVAALQVEES